MTVGLIFGSKSITLLMLNQVSDLKWQLINFAYIENKPGITRESREFRGFLKTSLNRFLGSHHSDVDIWAAVPSERVEMRHLVIPKVPDDQVDNAVFWNFNKLAQVNESDVVFDFSILDEIEEDKKQKLRVAAYAAPRQEIDELKALLSDIGFSPIGISIIPFAVQNIFRTEFIETDTNHVCALFIGRDWSRIDIFTNGDLVLSRGIKTGINSIIEAIRSRLHEEVFGDIGLKQIESQTVPTDSLPEQQVSDHSEEAEAIFNQLINNEAFLTDDQKTKYKIDEDGVFEAIMPVLERLVRQVERTIGHFSLNFSNESIGNVFLSGKITGNIRLTGLIESLMPYPIKPVDPFSSKMLSTENLEVPASMLKRDLFVPAMGLALSNNMRTPNFLFTFRNKRTLAKVRQINRIVFSIFLMITVICVGLFYWQGIKVDQKKDTINILKQKMNQYSPKVDLELIQKITAKTVSSRQQEALVAEKYLSLAIINELSELIPDNIKLLSIKADFGCWHNGGDKNRNSTLLMEGIITDLPSERETTLAVLMLKLNESSILGNEFKLISKKVEKFENKEVLRFSARMELING